MKINNKQLHSPKYQVIVDAGRPSREIHVARILCPTWNGPGVLIALP